MLPLLLEHPKTDGHFGSYGDKLVRSEGVPGQLVGGERSGGGGEEGVVPRGPDCKGIVLRVP